MLSGLFTVHPSLSALTVVPKGYLCGSSASLLRQALPPLNSAESEEGLGPRIYLFLGFINSHTHKIPT